MSSETVHLLVLIHGMWGNPDHLAEMRRIMREIGCQSTSQTGPDGEKLEILNAETNRDDSTYDGVDWGGERVAEEIYEEVKRLEEEGKKVTRFSITGYSLGGLIARYVVGILHQRKFFDNVSAVNFNTVATPHVGLPRYSTMISSLFAFLGPKLLSRTGEQFYVVDKWSANGRPLLEVMADPERIFFQALTLFPHIRIYANAVNDMTVPYPTAAIEYDDIFANHTLNGMQIDIDEEYAPIIKSYTTSSILALPPKPRIFTGQWFKNLKPNRPLLPPALQFGFPYNVLIMLVTPVLIPLLITLILSRLSMASIASRKRIKKLETDESSSERLAHILGKLERGMEDAMVELLDSQGSPDPEAVPVSDGEPQIGETPKQESELSSSSTEFPQATEPLVLNDTQRKIITLLNTLPNLKKELAFIHPVRNAHATIISRDIKRFPSHKIGEGVLRHWADHFII